MKHFLNIFFADELARWQTYGRRAKAAAIYFAASLLLFALCVMSGSLLAIIPAVINTVVALNVAATFIPDFYKED